MVKLFSTYFPTRNVLLAASETLIVFTLLPLASLMDPVGDIGVTPANGLELLRLGVAGLVCLACFYYQDLYKPGFASESYALFGRLFRAVGVTSVALAVLYILFPAAQLDNAILGIWLVAAASAIIQYSFLALSKSSRWSASTVVIGDGRLASQAMRIIRSRSELGLKLIGYLGEPSRSTPPHDAPCLGPVESLPEIIKDIPIQRVIVAMSDRRARLPVETLLDLKAAGSTVQEGAEFLELSTGRISVTNLRPSWLVFGPGFRLSKLRSFSHRCLSLVVSAAILFVCLPIIPIIVLFVSVTSPGPLLFRQTRTGKNGRLFTLYKFRTMRHKAESHTGAVWASKNDPRVTRVGKFLRATRLDEIPQLWNILVGDMAFVGPRPERPEFVGWLSEKIPYYDLRHAIQPGLTGWAQVRYPYGASLEDSLEKLQYDLFYVKHMSIGLDLLIIFKTIKVVLAGMGS